MKKSGVFWTIALLLSLLAAGCSSAKPNTENVVAVGHVAALSGDLALWGQAEKNALTLTVEKINAAGGVAGKQLKIISMTHAAMPRRPLKPPNDCWFTTGSSQSSVRPRAVAPS